jgi:cytochrome P450
MLSAEGETHRRYKTQCSGPFNARAVREDAGPAIERALVRLVAALPNEGVVDLRPALASPLAVETVATVLGIPDQHRAAIRPWYDDFALALANFRRDPDVRARGRGSAAEFRRAMAPVLHELQCTDSSSLLAVLGRTAPGRLTDEEILSNALIVLFGGIETTESTILNVLWSLLVHPHALARVRREPAALPRAIEEAIRWEPAVQSCTRHVAEPLEFRSVRLEAGDVVQCMIGAANRDPAHFADPDRFDIDRGNASDHLSFGSGAHYCLGAALARAEVRAVLSALLERYGTIELDPAQPSAPRGYEFRAPPVLSVLLRGEQSG